MPEDSTLPVDMGPVNINTLPLSPFSCSGGLNLDFIPIAPLRSFIYF